MSRKIRLAQCWNCGHTALSHPSLYQFVSKPDDPMDRFTCDCLKEPYPDTEEADYGEVT